MQTIIKDFSKSFVRLKVWQADGSYIETTLLSNKSVLYWARTPSGLSLVGIDRDGLDKILAILGELEKEERGALQYALKELSEAGFDQLEVDIELICEGPRYKTAYRDTAADMCVRDAFDDVAEFLAAKRGYAQSI